MNWLRNSQAEKRQLSQESTSGKASDLGRRLSSRVPMTERGMWSVSSFSCVRGSSAIHEERYKFYNTELCKVLSLAVPLKRTLVCSVAFGARDFSGG